MKAKVFMALKSTLKLKTCSEEICISSFLISVLAFFKGIHTIDNFSSACAG